MNVNKYIGFLGILLFLGFSINLSAQKVKVKKDLASVDGEEYLMIKKEKSGMWRPHFDISSLDGDPLLYWKFSFFTLYEDGPKLALFTIKNIETGDTLVIEQTSDVYGPKQIVAYIHKNGLIENGKLNQSTWDSYVASVDPNLIETYKEQNTPSLDRPVRRYDGPLALDNPLRTSIVAGRKYKLLQGTTEVGSKPAYIGYFIFEDRSKKDRDYKEQYLVYYLPNDIEVSRTWVRGFNGKYNSEVETHKDGKKYKMRLPAFDQAIMKVLNYLVENGYM